MYGLSAKTNGSCKEVAVVERLKQYSVYGLSAKKQNGRCREVAVGGRCGEVVVSGGSTVFRNSSECLIQINRTSTNREKPNEFSSLQSRGVTTKWTLKD